MIGAETGKVHQKQASAVNIYDDDLPFELPAPPKIRLPPGQRCFRVE